MLKIHLNNMPANAAPIAKKNSEKFKRIKCSTLANLLNGNNFHESIYNWNENEEQKFNQNDNRNDTESIYSMVSDNT
jgi:hypothetical protein